MDHYAGVNERWKETALPSCTSAEALRAARRLARHFGGALPTRARRCWVAVTPPFDSNRGWSRLVHDMSHRVYARQTWQNRKTPQHSAVHAELELRMTEYVIGSGWLSGSLRETKKPAPTTADKLDHVRALIKRWESKARRAKFALYKLNRRERRMREQLQEQPA